MRLKKLKYRVRFKGLGSLEVSGFAIDSGLPVRICVHEAGGVWICDHYDSGRRYGCFHSTRKDAVRSAVDDMKQALDDGTYAKAIRRINRTPNANVTGLAPAQEDDK